MKIGIFGGTFDPFTRAHREIVKQALEQKVVDFVHICPTIVTWHRKGYVPWLSDEDRVRSIEAILGNDPVFKHTTIYLHDLRLKKIAACDESLKERFVDSHRFIDTLLHIKCIYDDNVELYPIIGSDEYQHFTSWHAYKSILDNCTKLVVAVDEDGCGRDGKKIDSKMLSKDIVPLRISNEFREISASKIRSHFKSFDEYLSAALKKIKAADSVLLKTPIFNVTKGKPTYSGLEPILVNAPDWVTVVAKRGNELLLESQYRYGSASIVEEFPCGMVEAGESPLDAAKRELEEEIGICITDKKSFVKLGQTNPNPAFMTNTMHYYFVDLDKAKYIKKKQKLDKHEKLKFYFKDNEKFCRSIFDKVLRKDSKVPAMLVTALTLCAFYLENRKEDDDV